MNKTFTFYTDPAHGWIKVPRKLLGILNIEKDISNFSYQRGADVYLEEDGDASAFFRAYVAKYGVEPKMTYQNANRDSRIRSYESYRFLTPALWVEQEILRDKMKAHTHWDSASIKRINAAGLETLQFWAAAYGF